MDDKLTERTYGEIAVRLRRAREAFGLDQTEFARRAGLKNQTYSNWESGNFRISIDGALALRETYGLSMDFIYCGNIDALPHKIAKAIESSPRVRNST